MLRGRSYLITTTALATTAEVNAFLGQFNGKQNEATIMKTMLESSNLTSDEGGATQNFHTV